MSKRNILISMFLPFVLLTILACQGGPLASVIATPTPTITPTPLPTSTPTPSPTPTPIPEGVSQTEQADGSILFTDYDNKFQLTLPKGWIVVPVTVEDISEMIDQFAAANPDLSEALEMLKNLDPETIRMVALNEDPRYIQSGFASNLTITAFEDQILSAMPIAFVAGALESTLESNGAKVLTSGANVLESTDDVEIGVIETEQSVMTATGEQVTVYSKYLLFQSAGKLIMIQLTTISEFANELGAVLGDIAETVELLEP